MQSPEYRLGYLKSLTAEFKGLSWGDKTILSLIASGVMIVGGILPVVGVVKANINQATSDTHFFTASASQPDINIAEMRRQMPNASMIELMAEQGIPMRVYLTDSLYSGQLSKEISIVKKIYPASEIAEDYTYIQKGRNGGPVEGSFRYDQLGVNRAVLYYP